MEKNSKNKPSNKTYSSAIKYSGLAFQMFATITLGVFLGKFLDNKFSSGTLFTAICSLIFVLASFYFLFKDFIKK